MGYVVLIFGLAVVCGALRALPDPSDEWWIVYDVVMRIWRFVKYSAEWIWQTSPSWRAVFGMIWKIADEKNLAFDLSSGEARRPPIGKHPLQLNLPAYQLWGEMKNKIRR